MDKYEKVLVTGGSGFVGSNLKEYKPNWDYPTSTQLNLLDYEGVKEFLENSDYDAIVHLAARVGGIKDNNNHQSEFFEKNTLMNTNLLKASRECRIPRVLCSLSTCIFPDVHENYPMTEDDIMNGPPQQTHFAYAISKRAMYTHIKALRKEGFNYSCFTPSNIYGPYDNFDESGHFVAALVRKIYEAEETLNLWGTGKPLRQFLYVKDLVKFIPIVLENFEGSNVIITPKENMSINDAAKIAINTSRKNLNIEYNKKLDGQFRKDCSNKLLRTITDLKFTNFDIGIKETYEWYRDNQEKL